MTTLNADAQTILFLAANPKNTARFRLDQELRDIAEGLQRAQKRAQFNLEQLSAVRPRDIQRAMLDLGPNILHFSGDGGGETGLVFEDEIGNTKLVDGEALASLFELFADQLRCVVLNGCYTEVQAKAIAQHIPYVIGMNKAIGDKAAIAFAVGFYDALGAGRDVEFAYKLGCSAIRLEGIEEYLTPVLIKKPVIESKLTQEFHQQKELGLLMDKLFQISTNTQVDDEYIIAELCKVAHSNELIHIVGWERGENQRLSVIFRECRRGWYFQLFASRNQKGNWEEELKICPIFIPLLEPDEKLWLRLTKSALSEDWHAIDEIVHLGIKFPGSELRIVGPYAIGENVADEALEEFGLYVPDSSLLPGFLFMNKRLGIILMSYFKHSHGFGKETIVCDDNTNECHLFDSLDMAQQYLEKSLLDQQKQNISKEIKNFPFLYKNKVSHVKPNVDSPIETFISYSSKDNKLKDALLTHLANLKRQKKITAWQDRAIEGGQEWEAQIKQQLESAQIILLLISPDFMASDYCYDIEMERAIARHDAGTARVIPVILRPCDWKDSPFSKLQALPKDAKAVTQWSDRDAAFLNVVQGIRSAVESLSAP